MTSRTQPEQIPDLDLVDTQFSRVREKDKCNQRVCASLSGRICTPPPACGLQTWSTFGKTHLCCTITSYCLGEVKGEICSGLLHWLECGMWFAVSQLQQTPRFRGVVWEVTATALVTEGVGGEWVTWQGAHGHGCEGPAFSSLNTPALPLDCSPRKVGVCQHYPSGRAPSCVSHSLWEGRKHLLSVKAQQWPGVNSQTSEEIQKGKSVSKIRFCQLRSWRIQTDSARSEQWAKPCQTWPFQQEKKSQAASSERRWQFSSVAFLHLQLQMLFLAT